MQSETENKRKAMKDKIKRGIWRISDEEREGGLVCALVIQWVGREKREGRTARNWGFKRAKPNQGWEGGPRNKIIDSGRYLGVGGKKRPWMIL